jgi:hypothetical protein
MCAHLGLSVEPGDQIQSRKHRLFEGACEQSGRRPEGANPRVIPIKLIPQFMAELPAASAATVSPVRVA